jgi:hypothetical protein
MRITTIGAAALAVIALVATVDRIEAGLSRSCGAGALDPDIAASFARFDRQQSMQAQQVCHWRMNEVEK